MKKILYKSFIIFLFMIQLSTVSFCDDVDEEIIDVDSEIETSINSSTSKSEIPSINSRSCVVLDRNSKIILFGKNEKNKVKMASTTNLMATRKTLFKLFFFFTHVVFNNLFFS